MLNKHPTPFLLERWFAEFEFVPGMRSLAASGAFAPSTAEVLRLGGAEATDRYLALGLDYIENPGGAGLREAVAAYIADQAAPAPMEAEGKSGVLEFIPKHLRKRRYAAAGAGVIGLALLAAMPSAASPSERNSAAFRRLDANGDGVVTLQEFEAGKNAKGDKSDDKDKR